ncbi:outer membrane protein assembly factor, partial [Plectonema cf. radiosum LEGE 06105]
MRVSSAAIFTLVSLAASNIHQQATANDSTAIPDNQQGENLVIPVVEGTPASTEVISQPETLITQQFSQKSVNSEQLSVNSEQLSVNSKQLSVNSEQLSVNSKQLSVQNQQKQTQIVIKNGSNPP